jgi:hypothetical protein
MAAFFLRVEDSEDAEADKLNLMPYKFLLITGNLFMAL